MKTKQINIPSVLNKFAFYNNIFKFPRRVTNAGDESTLSSVKPTLQCVIKQTPFQAPQRQASLNGKDTDGRTHFEIIVCG